MKGKLYYFFALSAIFSTWTYIPVFAKELGMSDTKIGFIVSIYSFAFFISSFIFGRASDRYGRKLFIMIGAIASSITFFLHFFINDYISFLFLRFLIGFCVGIYPAALIAYVYEKKRNLGKFSGFGSLGWALGSLIAGIIATYFSIKGIFILSSFLFFISFIISLTMKPLKHVSIEVPKFPTKLIKKNLSIYIPIFIRHTGSFLVWTFWALYLQELGASLFWIGIINSINMITQFFLMSYVSDKFKTSTSMKLGLFLSGLTFLGFAMAKNFWQIIPTQIILAASWSFLYVGAIKQLSKNNKEKATVNGILSSTLGLSSFIGPLLATIAIQFVDYKMMMYLASLSCFFAFLLFMQMTKTFKFLSTLD